MQRTETEVETTEKQEEKASEILARAAKLLNDVSKVYEANFELMKEQDALQQDLLHKLEIENLTRDERAKLAAELGVGVPTLEDMIEELLRPGRDMRDSLPKPLLRTDVLDMKDLTPGMQLTGTVRNVIDFGAFVDIGVHQDGLVHISQISSRFIRHPSEVLKVGDVVTVWVLSVDLQKKRIALTMKQPKTEQAH